MLHVSFVSNTKCSNGAHLRWLARFRLIQIVDIFSATDNALVVLVQKKKSWKEIVRITINFENYGKPHASMKEYFNNWGSVDFHKGHHQGSLHLENCLEAGE